MFVFFNAVNQCCETDRRETERPAEQPKTHFTPVKSMHGPALHSSDVPETPPEAVSNHRWYSRGGGGVVATEELLFQRNFSKSLH